MGFDWKAAVATVAPAVASMFGTPLAGVAVSAGLAAFGIKGADAPQNQDEAERLLAQKMASATPADLLNLKKENHQFEKDMATIGVDLERVAAGDRDSARSREIQLRDNAPKMLAAVVVCGFFATLYTIAFVQIPESAGAAINILLGALTAMLTQVGNYYFGSSAGSARKNEMLAARRP